MALGKSQYILELMSVNPMTLRPDDKVMEHLKIFEEHNINHVPVIDKDKTVAGLLTRRDFENYVNIVKIIQGGSNDPVHVRDVMNTTVFTYSKNVLIVDAAQAMVDNDIHAIIIVDDNKHLLGIVTSTDLLKHLADRDRYSRFA